MLTAFGKRLDQTEVSIAEVKELVLLKAEELRQDFNDAAMPESQQQVRQPRRPRQQPRRSRWA